MDYNVFMDLLGNNCFPIVMSLILCYYIFTTQKSLAEAISQLKDTLTRLETKIEDIRRD